MKVIHLLSSDRYSGAENVACQIISLMDKDIQCVYVSPNGQIAEALKERKIRFMPINKMSIKEVRKIIKQEKPDVIHAHDPRAICMAALSTRKITIIAHVHNNRPDFRKKTLLSTVFYAMVRHKNIKHIFWVSDAAHDQFVYKNAKSVSTKSEILYNIIDRQMLIAKANKTKDKTKYDVVYIGRLTYQKNPQRLIGICNQLVQQQPNVQVAIIGSGDMYNDCAELINKYGIADNVHLLGFMDNAYGILKNSKVFLLSSRYEGTPMVILEAQCFGLPVVSTRIEELKKVVNTQTGFYYDTDGQAVSQILNILNSAKLQQQLNKQIIDFSVNYNDLENYKKRILKIYK